MGFHNPDPYNQPEHFDLTVVAEIQYEDDPYAFDMRVVWSHPELGLLTAEDSGCSCNAPFELLSFEDLERVDFESLKSEIRRAGERKYGPLPREEGRTFLKRVKNAM